MTQVPTSTPDAGLPVRQPRDRVFLLVWVIAYALSELIGENLAPHAGNLIGGPLGDWATHFVVAVLLLEIPRSVFTVLLDVSTHAVAGLFAGLVGGLVVGLGQWLALRIRMKGMFLWFLYTIFAYSLVGMLSSGLGTLIGNFGLVAIILFFVFLEAPMTAVIVGGGQWLLLRGKLKNSFFWILFIWLREILNDLIFVGTGLLGISIFSVDTPYWLFGDCLLLIIAVLFGLGSGALLTWLMSKDTRFAKFVTPE
jgi:hypothetical protein